MGIVWIESERCWGEVVSRYFHFSLVSFFKDGMFHEEIIENDELIDLKDLGIDYESQ
jgi:hypothetical protein